MAWDKDGLSEADRQFLERATAASRGRAFRGGLKSAKSAAALAGAVLLVAGVVVYLVSRYPGLGWLLIAGAFALVDAVVLVSWLRKPTETVDGAAFFFLQIAGLFSMGTLAEALTNNAGGRWLLGGFMLIVLLLVGAGCAYGFSMRAFAEFGWVAR